MPPLPVDALLPELVERLGQTPSLVLEAAPGAGKTTRVPAALLEATQGEILVSEPRRLPARLAAGYVAAQLGERVGGTVGYSVRFEDVSSRATRVRYVTEGVLIRRLIGDETLSGVGAVVLDEFHERHLDADLALALLRRLQQTTRPDLKLVVMSATLQAEPVARFLGDCPRLRSEGRVYPVTIEFLDRPDDRPLEKQVVSAVRRALLEGPDGDVLVFLPGAAEIRRALAALEPICQSADVRVLPLHGDLPIEEQARAVAPAERRKVVLSTNVAESSVTVEGVTTIIDAGLARVATHSPWSGLPTLALAKISRASATQRAGRAGRTAPGRVLRLYTRGDFETRPEHDPPEVERLDLSEALLVLHAAGVQKPGELPWLTPPPAAALSAAETLLDRLGAVSAEGRLSAIGARLLELPLHPRLGRILVEGERRGVAKQAALVAALIGERDIRARAPDGFGQRRAPRPSTMSGPSDVLDLLDRFTEGADRRRTPARLRSLGLNPSAVSAVERARQKLAPLARNRIPPVEDEAELEHALLKCILTGFADRVARRRRPGDSGLVLSSGATAHLDEASVVHHPQFMVAVDVEDRPGRGGARVRLASAIEPEWLLDLSPELVEAREQLVLAESSGRVERLSRLVCGSVVLDESRSPAPADRETAAFLAEVARRRGFNPWSEPAAATLRARLSLLGEQMPELELPDVAARTEASLDAICEGLTSLAELEALDASELLLASLTPEQRRALERDTPAHVVLPGGRRVAVRYELDKPPYIESRLQDFFGLADGPSICRGRVPLTLHLLAPNQRAVQVTRDLSGFWERHYPGIRRELKRRYPKHAWPEDGRTATPPAPRAR
ncbi:MAG TPA: ATP-dependent helicase HrpB [Polyangiaceae bacterium]|nr:ATP-dependent helicase HrpB [Polyangiaceae bacterium]